MASDPIWDGLKSDEDQGLKQPAASSAPRNKEHATILDDIISLIFQVGFQIFSNSRNCGIWKNREKNPEKT